MALLATHPLTARENERIKNVLVALNRMFGWNLPWQGDVIPIGPIGGHYNVHFKLDGRTDELKADLGQSGVHAIPPGYRFWIGKWTLHLAEIRIEDDLVVGRAHIDRGDPDRDVPGFLTHVFYDGLWGHLDSDIDPV